jgi:anti-sigma-K factor RskA
MDEERGLLEVDARLRAAVAPDVEAARRIAARALADDTRPTQRRWRAPLAIAIVAAIVVIAGVAAFQWRRSTAAVPSRSLTITSAGSMLVVESPDGRRWVVGSSTPRRSGNFVMVVSE